MYFLKRKRFFKEKKEISDDFQNNLFAIIGQSTSIVVDK